VVWVPVGGGAATRRDCIRARHSRGTCDAACHHCGSSGGQGLGPGASFTGASCQIAAAIPAQDRGRARRRWAPQRAWASIQCNEHLAHAQELTEVRPLMESGCGSDTSRLWWLVSAGAGCSGWGGKKKRRAGGGGGGGH